MLAGHLDYTKRLKSGHDILCLSPIGITMVMRWKTSIICALLDDLASLAISRTASMASTVNYAIMADPIKNNGSRKKVPTLLSVEMMFLPFSCIS